jgi:geranylgeranyl pyrophosphate synthase
MNTIELFESIGPNIMQRTQDLEMGFVLPDSRQAIEDALRQTVLLGGKRLRPLLTYLVGRSLGKSLEELDLFARSIEQVHAASLSHDDVIDNATKRRGKESINVLTSNKKAILAGDYLLANVITQLTQFGNIDVVSKTAQVISELSEGEWLQMELIENRSYTRQKILDVANYKTASVMKWCCVVPALISGLNSDLINRFEQFGYHLGLGFQLIDDTLDFNGNKEKEALIDLQNGIVNMVLFDWMESDASAKKAYENGESLESLWNDEYKAMAVSKTKSLAIEHIDKCYTCLDDIESKLNESNSDLVESFVEGRKLLGNVLLFLKNRQI